jgi:hypothetical protein
MVDARRPGMWAGGLVRRSWCDINAPRRVTLCVEIWTSSCALSLAVAID